MLLPGLYMQTMYVYTWKRGALKALYSFYKLCGFQIRLLNEREMQKMSPKVMKQKMVSNYVFSSLHFFLPQEHYFKKILIIMKVWVFLRCKIWAFKYLKVTHDQFVGTFLISLVLLHLKELTLSSEALCKTKGWFYHPAL